ncbi:MAG: hypothetical protein LUQ31_07985 [Methanoregula sp.]|nr:hypothetical protein [Methanoregula sp.]
MPRIGINGLLICLVSCLLIPGVFAADEYYTGYLGDTIDLHGYSYRGGEVYLFMTGPGLPTNGVTLTDVTQRADQGQFTMVDVDSSYQWSMKWDTSRIWNEIDPGTYIVYVTTEPVDFSNLGGSSTYKTLSVYLKDSGSRTDTSGGTSYTLKPEEHISTIVPTTVTTTVITPNVSQSTPLPSVTLTTPETTATSTVPTTTQSGLLPFTAVFAVIAACAGIIFYRT